MVTADEIPWTLEPASRAEAIDLLMLDDVELFEHAEFLRRELQAERGVRSVAIQRIRQLTHELHVNREQLARVRNEYRALRVQTMEKSTAA
jgi:hypothetical protein